MSMKSYLGVIAAMAALGTPSYTETGLSGSNPLKPEDIPVNKNKPIPKGCKRYFYNKNGLCNESESEVYFDCLKPAKAYEKYQRWLTQLTPNRHLK